MLKFKKKNLILYIKEYVHIFVYHVLKSHWSHQSNPFKPGLVRLETVNNLKRIWIYPLYNW